MTVLLFANGDLELGGWIQPHLESATMVIAANGGTTHLRRLGVIPDVVIGDLDSLPQNVRKWLQEYDVDLILYPQNKDENDLELALHYAAAHTHDLIKVFAASGGRLDQTLANIQLLAHPDLIDRRIELVTAYERAWLVTGKSIIVGEKGDYVSLIPLGGTVQVSSTSGLQWPLEDEPLTFGPARGVSNKMTEGLATISIRSGAVLVIHTRKEWQR